MFLKIGATVIVYYLCQPQKTIRTFLLLIIYVYVLSTGFSAPNGVDLFVLIVDNFKHKS